MIIAHRGNVNGPDPKTENREDTIVKAINLGFDCEIDVWKVNGQLWLGHDGPEHETTIEFLTEYRSRLWVHCKNLDALIALKDEYNCFFHDKDTYTLTSKGYIWGNIGSHMTSQTIQVMPERANEVSTVYLGVCTDYPFRYIQSR